MRSLTSLRAKLMALVALPLLVLVVVAVVAARNASRAAADATDTADRIDLAVAASSAALQLAQERALSASTLQSAGDAASAGAAAEAVPEELELQREQTSAAVDDLRQAAGPGADDAPLGSALERLGRLDAARSSVDDRAAEPSAVLDSYTEIIDPVLDFDETLADIDDPTLITGISSHEALTRAIQDVALEQSLLAPVFASGQVDPATYERLLGVVTTQGLWLNLFEDKASMIQQRGYEELATVPAVATVQRLREQVLSAGPSGTVDPDAEVWTSATGRKLDLLEGIAENTADQLTAGAAGAKADANRARTTTTGLAGGALLLAAGVAFLLWRHVLRPFGRHVTATQIALDEGTAVPVPPADELRALASAFNQVQEAGGHATAAPGDADGHGGGAVATAITATTTAATTAATTATAVRPDDRVYLSFGRRTQDLISEQLRHIDELESRTEDPDMLADLFLLDHLATRLRRNAESQVVMAGADSPRPWSRPVSVTNVVRAAAAEAADYSLVEVQPMPPASIVGVAANDVSHLLAELIDEALDVLPQHLRVVIGGARQRDGGYILAISGVGLRLTPSEIAAVNELLAGAASGHDPRAGRSERGPATTGADPAEPEPLDDDLRFRFYVVAQLARRHQVDVRLSIAPGGTIAEVTLPWAVLADGKSPEPAPEPAAVAAPPPPGSPPSPPPATGGQPTPIRPSTKPTTRRRTGAHSAPPPAEPKATELAPERQPRFRGRLRKVVERASSRRSVDPWAEWQDG